GRPSRRVAAARQSWLTALPQLRASVSGPKLPCSRLDPPRREGGGRARGLDPAWTQPCASPRGATRFCGPWFPEPVLVREVRRCAGSSAVLRAAPRLVACVRGCVRLGPGASIGPAPGARIDTLSALT